MMMKRRKAQGANRSAFCVPGCKWIVFTLLAILVAGGCSYFRPRLTATELRERLRYSRDRALEELVAVVMARGYRAVNGEGQARQVLELDHSNSGAIHRQFFEVQPRDKGLSEVFFLENRGSVVQTQFSRFPRHLRKAIREFLEGLPEARSEEYRPLLIRQEKLSRSMMVYAKSNGARVIQFTQKVASLEKSNLYGLFHLSAARFIFFGKKSEEVFRTDYLEADDRHKQLVEKFLETFRPQLKL
jgi:hypothetical protein